MDKKIIVALIVVSTFASVLGGYLLTKPSRKSGESLNQQSATLIDRFDDENSGSGTAINQTGPLQITEVGTLAAFPEPAKDSVIYYQRDNGYVSRVDLNNRISSPVSKTMLSGLFKIVWAPDTKSVISMYSSNKGTLTKFFNYESRENVSLGTDILSAAFSPDGISLATAKKLGDENDIVLTSPDGQGAKNILRTRFDNISLSWPQDNTIAFMAGDPKSSSLYVLTPEGKLDKVLDELPNLAVAWNHDASQVLYSYSQDDQNILAVKNISDGDEVTMPINASADQCAWRLNNKSIICMSYGDGGISIVSVSLDDLSVKTLYDNLSFVPENVFMSSLDDYFVMVSRTDHTLWSVPIQ